MFSTICSMSINRLFQRTTIKIRNCVRGFFNDLTGTLVDLFYSWPFPSYMPIPPPLPHHKSCKPGFVLLLHLINAVLDNHVS